MNGIAVTGGLAAGLCVIMSVGMNIFSATGAMNGRINGGIISEGKIPNGWGPAVQAAGDSCPQIGAPVLAAQLHAESNWKADAVSPVGAQGLAQFMPDTWAEHGVDGDGDGIKDPFNPLDAIPAAAKFDCWLWNFLEKKGLNPTVQLVLAAYNAGPGAVLRHGGIPPFAETQQYVAKIMAAAPKFGHVLTPDTGLVEGERAAVIAQAKKWIGTPYSWGGGGINGPTKGFGRGKDTVGFDCSSLMQYAYYHGAKVRLPRVTRQQVKEGSPVSLADLRPGDLILFAPGPNEPVNHVGLWLGDGQMLHAPRTGKNVEITTITGNSYWEGKTWHMRKILS